MLGTILVVDDDDLMRRSLSFHLQKADYQVITAESAEIGLELAQTTALDLVLLDINLPGLDGLQALRHFRDELGVPVIFLSARRREIDEILGLELGANDYITKPFDKDVLLARIRATLRHVRAASPSAARSEVLTAGDLVVDTASHTVTVAGAAVVLAPREFQVLHTLAQTAEQVLSVDELLDRVWGAEFHGEPQVVYFQICALREKLEADPARPRCIQTVRGVGYELVPAA
jgi:DNA-binding response OmpR family regulator